MSRKLWILARQGLADLSQAPNADLILLLEGSWSEGGVASDSDGSLFPQGRFALDTLLDSRWGWIDEEAARLADLAADAPLTFPSFRTASSEHTARKASPGASEGAEVGGLLLRPEWIDALALRYAMVRWLRVVSFFTEIQPLQPGQVVEAFLSPVRDEDYGLLLQQLTHQAKAQLALHWRPDDWQEPVWLAPNQWWRRCLGRLAKWGNPSLSPSRRKDQVSDRPCVVLCGNARILDPVCQAFLDQQVRVWWLYERFAVRAWFRWRRFGVGQVWCDQFHPSFSGADRTRKSYSASTQSERCQGLRSEENRLPEEGGLLLGRVGPLECQGIDLGPVVQQWVHRRLHQAGGRYRQWIEAVERHLARLRPRAVVLDEDATPFARVVLAAARSQGIRTWVVQHGAPYIRFGFAPLEADYLCAWDQASLHQFRQWGIPKERIRITGSPWQERLGAEIRRHQTASGRVRSGRAGKTFVRLRPSRKEGEKETGFRVLLLTTVPPRDHRPDPVCFHLTTETYGKMIRSAFAATARMADARLIVKLHPRCGHDPWIEAVRHEFPHLPVRLVTQGSLAECLVQADCVLSCVSSAGVDAVWAGWPVIHLVPEGSSECLPAAQWGFVGAARTEAEVFALLCQVRSGWPVSRGSGGRAVGNVPSALVSAEPLSSGEESAAGCSHSASLVPEGRPQCREPALSAAERIVQTVLETIDTPAFWEASVCGSDGKVPWRRCFSPSSHSEKIARLF